MFNVTIIKFDNKKLFKKKILIKPLLKKRNKRKKQKNWKNILIAKIRVWAVYLLLKTKLLPTKLIKTSIALIKYAANFYIFLKDFIYKKKIWIKKEAWEILRNNMKVPSFKKKWKNSNIKN